MSKKSEAKARKTVDQRNNELMNHVWTKEELAKIKRWNRKEQNGFTTLPRWLPLVCRIMDKLSSGKPLSSTYLSLWFRGNDDAFINIKDEASLAFESGFDIQRKIYTWKQRMKLLKEFNFIEVKQGDKSEYQYVLIREPYQAIMELGEKIQQKSRLTLIERMKEVGAYNIEEDIDENV